MMNLSCLLISLLLLFMFLEKREMEGGWPCDCDLAQGDGCLAEAENECQWCSNFHRLLKV